MLLDISWISFLFSLIDGFQPWEPMSLGILNFLRWSQICVLLRAVNLHRVTQSNMMFWFSYKSCASQIRLRCLQKDLKSQQGWISKQQGPWWFQQEVR